MKKTEARFLTLSALVEGKIFSDELFFVGSDNLRIPMLEKLNEEVVASVGSAVAAETEAAQSYKTGTTNLTT